MRRIFWMIFLFGAYMWIVSSGKEEFFLTQGKALYQMVVSWFDEAEVDFQVNKPQSQKKHRR